MSNKFIVKEKEGSLFINKNKETDKHPTLTGSCVINGVKMNISAWKNVAESGVKYYRLKFDEFQAKSSTSSTKEPEFEDGMGMPL
tara:strand:+ start:21 stop:275 length:255 start_codon:yes stop_codon:yes gene_type:complete